MLWVPGNLWVKYEGLECPLEELLLSWHQQD